MEKIYPKSKKPEDKFKVVAIKSFRFKADERSPLELIEVGMVKELYLHDACEMISSNKGLLYQGETPVGKIDKEVAAKYKRAGGGKAINAGVPDDASKAILLLVEKIDKLADSFGKFIEANAAKEKPDPKKT